MYRRENGQSDDDRVSCGGDFALILCECVCLYMCVCVCVCVCIGHGAKRCIGAKMARAMMIAFLIEVTLH